MRQTNLLFNKVLRYFINYFLGPVLFAWMSYSIYTQVIHQPNLKNSWIQIEEALHGPKVFLLIGVFLLMIVNWGVEAVKWKISVAKLQKVSYLTAFKAVISGVSFSVSTPNRIGEYLGRILYMDEGNRIKAISLTIAGSLSQLMITLFMGLLGIMMLGPLMEKSELITGMWIRFIFSGTLIVLVILTTFYFRISWMVKWIRQLSATRKFTWVINALEEFNATLLFRLLSLSAIRFLIFIAQYYLLIRLFNVDISWADTWWSVSVSFLVLAVIPTIALFTDLGLRGQISLKLLGLFSGNTLGIGFVTFGIWLINLILPALTGSLLILSIRRIIKKKA